MNAEDLERILDRKFATFKEDLAKEHKEESEKLIRKLKPTYDFKKRGTKIQFSFNQQVQGHMEDAKSHSEAGRHTKAVESLDEGIECVNKRQKLVLIADNSENGWRTVDEYVENVYASDSDDDKKIRRAEAAASRKKKDSSTRARGRGRRNGYGASDRRYDSYDGYNQSFRSFRGNYRGGYGNRYNYNAGKFGTRTGTCFGCNESGHWRFECPKTRGEQKF